MNPDDLEHINAVMDAEFKKHMADHQSNRRMPTLLPLGGLGSLTTTGSVPRRVTVPTDSWSWYVTRAKNGYVLNSTGETLVFSTYKELTDYLAAMLCAHEMGV